MFWKSGKGLEHGQEGVVEVFKINRMVRDFQSSLSSSVETDFLLVKGEQRCSVHPASKVFSRQVMVFRIDD